MVLGRLATKVLSSVIKSVELGSPSAFQLVDVAQAELVPPVPPSNFFSAPRTQASEMKHRTPTANAGAPPAMQSAHGLSLPTPSDHHM